ncbi:cupredoxin domain-containing protein [Microbulbifer hydrolyticus]|uniref:Cupredoxin domain-containing protein n=1 Tax=Microbulbifer hydrolyticus TaxID=48074 RepID=A0A6P1TBU9_9GAMM|nr:cupredoxin domain-containing protein [Microbulbifer hydrolyticus]MBB5212642.1 heme/copper-type cytochrome/quinol oxidase subunit 2 [Microbulbifer hydrolyticus]QHQ40244.1 cupredoxin domain-containing protein [Microbulbifer hydrolyticus]
MRDSRWTRARNALLVLPAIVFCFGAGRPEVTLEIRDHLFIPSELVVPANTKVKLIVHNRDKTPEEFESYELNREKVIMGGQKAIIFIGPLKPGEYPFFGEFNPKTAQGKVIAE